MRRLIASLAAFSAAVGLGMALATPVSAQPSPETVQVPTCDVVDTVLTDGSVAVLVYGPDCPYAGYFVEEGDPTIEVSAAGASTQRLLWHQAVGRAAADATCPEGWSASWAQWPNDGNGGFTCERTIDWGATGGSSALTIVRITINDAGDWVVMDPEDYDQWVGGCDLVDNPQLYDDVITNCT